MEVHVPLASNVLHELQALRAYTFFPGDLPEEARLRRFWCRVIIQQLLDAASHSRRSEALAMKQHAIAWLTSNSADFRCACDYAGLNPDKVANMCRSIFNSPDPEAYLVLVLPQTRTNGTHLQRRRGPKPKTIHDYANHHLPKK